MKTNQSTALGIDKSQRNVEIKSATCSSGQNYWTIHTLFVPSLWLLVDMKAPR